VVGVAATIHPIRTALSEVGVAVVFGVLTVLLVVTRSGAIPRMRGMFLIAAYCMFIFMTTNAAV
jgi:hypothetical protein